MSAAKKIYFYLPDYPDSSTGGILYHTKMFRHFSGKSQDVSVAGNKGIIKILMKYKFLKPLGGLLLYLSLPGNSVIVLTNTEYIHFLIPVTLFKFFKRHRLYMVVHHLLGDERNKKLKERFEYIFIRKADKVVTVSDATMESLLSRKLITGKIPVINPGMNYPVISAKPAKTSGTFDILYVGTIEERKDLLSAVRSLKMFAGSNVVFNIVGEALQAGYLESVRNEIVNLGLEKNVKFHGKLGLNELKDLYLYSDMFLFLSRWEGYGMVLAEALAFGLPVVGSDIPTMKYFVENGVNGFIADSGDIESVSSKIGMLKNNPVLQKQMSDESLRKARELPSWDAVCSSHYDIVKGM